MYNRGADNRRPSPSVKGEWRKKKKKSNCNILDFGEKRRKKKKKKKNDRNAATEHIPCSTITVYIIFHSILVNTLYY